MESRVVGWVLVWMAVACGGVAWLVAERMPVEVLAGISLGGWLMVVGGWFGVGETRETEVFRVGVHVGAAWAGVGVVEQFWGMWALYLPADPWLAAAALPGAVAVVGEEIGSVLAATPWVAGAMTVAAASSAVVSGTRIVVGRGWLGAWGWGSESGVVEKQWEVAVMVMACGGVSWLFAPRMPVEALTGVALVGSAMVAGAWLALPEERSTVVLRVSIYASAGWGGVGVLQQFWSMWAEYLPGNPWRAVVAVPEAVVEVHRGLEGIVTLTPWIAGTMTFFAGYFALGVAVGVLFGSGGGEKGRRQSGSELFGKSRLMGRRMMRRMSRHGGIIVGATEKGGGGELVTYQLEGASLTLAPPRTNKTSLIAGNLLAPHGKGYTKGSMVMIDPRGELFFVAAARRKALGRNVVLVDPFGVVKELAQAPRFKEVVRVPSTESVKFNPIDFIRDGNEGVGDIRALLEGLLTAPAREGADNARHFYESARAIMSGMVAYVHWSGKQGGEGTWRFGAVRRFLMASETDEKLMRDDVGADPSLGWGLPHDALARVDKVGQAEGGSNYSTIANQVDWLQIPELERSTGESTFDPMVLAEGNTDLFIVVPEKMVEASKPWLRLWVVIANAVAERKLDHAGITIVIDEAPRLGYLKPVVDSFYMAAGKGIRYQIYAQTKSAMDAVFQRENMEIMTDLAEVFQILEFPRANPEFADRVSKMIGNATFVNTSRSEQGTVAGDDVLRREQSSQAGTNRSLVKERLIPPEELMMLDVDHQIVLTNSKVAGREAMKLFLVRYWERADMKDLAGPNPYVLRKDAEREAA